jgi:hypothetical protein
MPETLIEQYERTRAQSPLDLMILMLDELNSVLVSLVDDLTTKNVVIKGWQHPLEALCVKLSLHVSSLQKLLTPAQLPHKGRRLPFIDISSIYIITRGIIENYLILYHCHFDQVPENQKEFRYFIYIISALKNRQTFTLKDTTNQAKFEEEKTVIRELTEAMKLNAYFLSLSEKQQASYLKSKEAKQISWSDLLDNCDLDPGLFKNAWKLLSNYAHSEFLSVLQARDFAKNPQLLIANAFLMGELSSIAVSHAITNTVLLFPQVKYILQNLTSDQSSVLTYFGGIAKIKIIQK